MIAQRPADAAPALQANAEALPLQDNSVDAALAVLTVQHWEDVERGLREMVRVARRRIPVDRLAARRAPERDGNRTAGPATAPMGSWRPSGAGPRRISTRSSATAPPRGASCLPVSSRALDALQDDLGTGEWDRRYGHLRHRSALDVGLRLVRAELQFAAAHGGGASSCRASNAAPSTPAWTV